MEEPLPVTIENAIQIAWDYLERSGELGNASEASQFLLKSIEIMVRQGERRRLRLSNKAIIDYQKHKAKQIAAR
jgi:hypothetical protein